MAQPNPHLEAIQTEANWLADRKASGIVKASANRIAHNATALAAELETLQALREAAKTYKADADKARASWVANGRRGASQDAIDMVNAARARAKASYDRLMQLIDES